MSPKAAYRRGGVTPIAELLDIGGFSLEDILEIEPGFLDEDAHEHDDAVQSFVFTSNAPLDSLRLQAFFRDAIASHGADLIRYKGIVAFEGLDQRVVFQGVHMLMNSDVGRDWGAQEARRSRIVFIGRDLPRAQWLSQLAACSAESARIPDLG